MLFKAVLDDLDWNISSSCNHAGQHLSSVSVIFVGKTHKSFLKS